MLAASAAAIAIGLTEPLWSVGRASLVSSYCMFQEGTFVPAELTLSIGLTHYNVSYENVAITASTVIDPEVSMTKGFPPGKLQSGAIGQSQGCLGSSAGWYGWLMLQLLCCQTNKIKRGTSKQNIN